MTCRGKFSAAGNAGRLLRGLFATLAGAVMVLAAAAAWAQGRAALVVDITGTSDPQVAAFDELEAGAKLRLGRETEITIMHYASCRELRLRGGTVVVGEAALETPGAQLLGGRGCDCPEMVTVSEASVVGAGVVLRSVSALPKVSPRPSFLIALAGGAGHDELRIQKGSEVVLHRPIDGARVRWDAADAPLAPGDYTVVLVGEGQTAHAARIRVAADGPDLIVLRP